MIHRLKKIAAVLVLGLFLNLTVTAEVTRLRCMWRDDPATTMVIGWDQISGHSPVLYYDRANHGSVVESYAKYQPPDKVIQVKGMNNHFVRLTNLQANTTYYFVISDSEGCSRTYMFKTAPDSNNERISIIAGGDSRNNRTARRQANLLVSKLRPDAIMFAGDMTGGDNAPQWIAWFDDWQYTMGSDGMLFPIIAARGNHELTDRVIEDLFDVPHKDVYYGLTMGGDLLRIYTLNSNIPPAGAQRQWLRQDLIDHQDVLWKFAQYHHSMRPHVSEKAPRNDLVLNWATLFYRFGVELVVESDIHVVKMTHPIRPSLEIESIEGFVRDDANGTVYIGEGCWGAPLRNINNDKPWTFASGSFNQFKWLFIDKEHVEVRTVKIYNALDVDEIDHQNRFEMPYGLDLWNPSGEEVFALHKTKRVEYEVKNVFAIENFNAERDGETVVLSWTSVNEPDNMIFDLERSLDGDEYESFNVLDGRGAGDRHSYRYTDDSDLAASQQYVKYRINPKLKEVSNHSAASKKLATIATMKEHMGGPGHSSERERIGQGERPRHKPPPPRVFGENKDQGEQNMRTDLSGTLVFQFGLNKPSDVMIKLINRKRVKLETMILNNQQPGKKEKRMNLSRYPDGKYLLIIEANNRVIKKILVSKLSV